MIKTIEIDKFKCFNSFQLNNLNRITIIGGKNNVGKTALLESIFLFHDRLTPDMIIKQFSWRGVESINIDPDSIWAPIFYNFNIDNDIKIKINNEEMVLKINKNYIPRIKPQNKRKENINIPTNGTSQNKPFNALDIEISENNKLIQKSHHIIDNRGLGHDIELSKSSPPIVSIISNRVNSVIDIAQGFSKLDETGETDLILETIKIIEPRIQSLSLNVIGNYTYIYGKLNHVSRKMPIAYLGDGINRLLSIITRIAVNKNGIVLIDEFENGIHYSVMSKMWEAVTKIAKACNCQVIATTHSHECLKYAYLGLNYYADDLCYFRLDRSDENNIFGKYYDYDILGAAINNDLEIR